MAQALALGPHQFDIAKRVVDTSCTIRDAFREVISTGAFIPVGYDPETDVNMLTFISKMQAVKRTASILSLPALKVLAIEQMNKSEEEGQANAFAYWYKELKDIVMHEEKMSQTTTRGPGQKPKVSL